MKSHKKFNNPICQTCIKRHMEKYKGFVDADGNTYKDFAVTCSGIPKNYLGEKLEALLSENEKKEALWLLDPVSWAADWLKGPQGQPWIARDYQRQMLRCTANRKIFRCGRRIGKTDTLVVTILYNAITRANSRILIVAPNKSHVGEITARIKSFVNNSDMLSQSVARSVVSPYYELEFYNGSKIKGFTAGTYTGNKGGTIRGQDADLLVIDEADYLATKDLQAIMAILATSPHVQFIASSTPTGKRSHFYKWCVESPTYKEFYFPTSVLPFWEEIKHQIRADYVGDPDGWTHEILAEFGEEQVSLFQNVYVDAALRDYRYSDQIREAGWVYSMGIDWNTEAGTEIVVVGFDGVKDFKVVDAINVPKQQWTQLAALEKVIEMQRKWICSFIYADEGAGLTAIELLRKYSGDVAANNRTDPVGMIKDILKAYNFSSKIEIRDPLTKQKVKKHAKPFLVENAVRFFEEQKIQISAHDAILKEQLHNYIIKHRTPSGVPVYAAREEKIGDHRLDALMLALVAFKLEASEFGQPNYVSSVKVFVPESVTPKQIAEQRVSSLPDERFNTEHSQIPGKTDIMKPKVYRHGFMTDEEEKFKAVFKKRNMRKRFRRRMYKPERTNF